MTYIYGNGPGLFKKSMSLNTFPFFKKGDGKEDFSELQESEPPNAMHKF